MNCDRILYIFLSLETLMKLWQSGAYFVDGKLVRLMVVMSVMAEKKLWLILFCKIIILLVMMQNLK